MIVMIIVILLAVLVAGSIKSNLMDAFSGDWMQFDEQQEPEMDNSEFDWGHNVNHNSEEE